MNESNGIKKAKPHGIANGLKRVAGLLGKPVIERMVWALTATILGMVGITIGANGHGEAKLREGDDMHSRYEYRQHPVENFKPAQDFIDAIIKSRIAGYQGVKAEIRRRHYDETSDLPVIETLKWEAEGNGAAKVKAETTKQGIIERTKRKLKRRAKKAREDIEEAAEEVTGDGS